jgi:hypothetical protein
VRKPPKARQVAVRSRLFSRLIGEGVFKIVVAGIDGILGVDAFLNALTATLRRGQQQISGSPTSDVVVTAAR